MSGGAASAPPGGRAPGLVTSAITGRVSVPDVLPGLGELWPTAFPDPLRVAHAAAAFESRPWSHRDGPFPRLVIAPGVLRLELPDLAKRYMTEQRARRTADRDRRELEAERDRRGDPKWKPPDPIPVRWVTEWSAKSRARMVRTLAELDYSPIVASGRMPCMVTLTLPDRWQECAPDGATFKALVKKFRKRWERAWGEPPAGVWKLEFQRRGAPHFHFFTVIPLASTAGELREVTRTRRRPAEGDGLRFQDWLKVAWAASVAPPDPEEWRKLLAAGTRVDYAEGLRMKDPKRVAVYFTKHGVFRDKEYQHVVPPEWREPGHGPGRFWGVWTLEQVAAAVGLTAVQRIELARVLRRYGRAADRARGALVQREVPRGVSLVTGRRKFRKVKRRPLPRLRSCSGFLCVSDGPALALALARVVAGSPGPAGRE